MGRLNKNVRERVSDPLVHDGKDLWIWYFLSLKLNVEAVMEVESSEIEEELICTKAWCSGH